MSVNRKKNFDEFVNVKIKEFDLANLTIIKINMTDVFPRTKPDRGIYLDEYR